MLQCFKNHRFNILVVNQMLAPAHQQGINEGRLQKGISRKSGHKLLQNRVCRFFIAQLKVH